MGGSRNVIGLLTVSGAGSGATLIEGVAGNETGVTGTVYMTSLDCFGELIDSGIGVFLDEVAAEGEFIIGEGSCSKFLYNLRDEALSTGFLTSLSGIATIGSSCKLLIGVACAFVCSI